jgi:putative ABC transport system permease protein
MQSLFQDICYGLRILRRNLGTTAVVLFSLAMGIGANTAVFSVINAVLLRPLPYAEPDRLTQLRATNQNTGNNVVAVTALEFVEWQKQNRSFEELAAYSSFDLSLTGDFDAITVNGFKVSTNLFRLLKVQPVLGRSFNPEDGNPGAESVVVISFGLWQRLFGGNRDVVGRSLILNDKSHQVIGIMPSDFGFPDVVEKAEAWTPHVFDLQQIIKREDRSRLSVVGRLKPEVTIRQAQSEMDLIARSLADTYSETNRNRGAIVGSLYEQFVGDVRPRLLILFSVVCFVMLIACLNVATLLLARSADRRKEMAIREALGAARRRLMRQMLTESVMLSLAGGALGLTAAHWGMRLLITMVPPSIPRAGKISLDGSVVSWTFLVSIIVGLLLGAAPYFQRKEHKIYESLKQGDSKLNTSMRKWGGGGLLIVAEVALSVVLLVGAGLMLRSLWHLQHVNLGFDPTSVFTASVILPNHKYPDKSQQLIFYNNVLERLRMLPGVNSVGATTVMPFGLRMTSNSFTIVSSPSSGLPPLANFRAISADYLRAMNISLLKGRAFTEQDTENAAKVCLINRNISRHFFADKNPLGQTVRSLGREWQIIGVVEDVILRPTEPDPGYELYMPYPQFPAVSPLSFVLRTTMPPAALEAIVRNEIHAVDKGQAIRTVKPMDQLHYDALSPHYFNALLLGIFATVALVLASIGLYALISYSVVRRKREIGIRLALGAAPYVLLKTIVGRLLFLSMIGLTIGLLAAFSLTRFIISLIYGVSATDPWTFIGATLLLSFIALVSCLLPARNALKVDPIITLRNE